MSTAATPTTTSDSFSVLVSGMLKGEHYRFYLYYDDNGTRTPIVEGEEYYAENNGAHTFSTTGLEASRDLMYTIAYLPAGKTDWSVSTDIQYAALRSTARTKDATPAKVWPGDWTKWANLKKGDSLSLIKASDWNDFLDRINEVIDYKGGTQVNWSGHYAYSGTTVMSAYYFNSTAAQAMASIGLSPPSANQGDPITADFFVQYGKALNAAK